MKEAEKIKIVEERLSRVETADLWTELAKRFNVKYGKIKMAIYGGKPSEYADLDVRLNVQEDLKERVV